MNNLSASPLKQQPVTGSIEDIRWAPRLPQALIRRLYELDAQGILDEELLDEVGWGLKARCESFIGAVEATWGRAPCPKCGAVIPHHSRPEEILTCPACGWSLSWKEYFSTIQRKQLSGAEPVLELFRAYIRGFTQARQAEEKMIAIDQVIHGFHIWVLHNVETRATAVNLIEGSLHDVVEFLDKLSYGPASTPGLRDSWLRWRGTIDQIGEKWQDKSLRRKPPEV